jgi:hypothetical protein
VGDIIAQKMIVAVSALVVRSYAEEQMLLHTISKGGVRKSLRDKKLWRLKASKLRHKNTLSECRGISTILKSFFPTDSLYLFEKLFVDGRGFWEKKGIGRTRK